MPAFPVGECAGQALLERDNGRYDGYANISKSGLRFRMKTVGMVYSSHDQDSLFRCST